MSNYRILIIGPQGSGKSTQAQILAKRMGLSLVNSGDIMRDFADDDSLEAREAVAAMEEGKMIDDDLAARLIRHKIKRIKDKDGFVVDGYPRSKEELDIYNPDYTLVIYLDISDQEAEKRLLQRGRDDDSPEAIKERLSLFHKLTKPLLDYYQKQGKLIKVSGAQPVEQVSSEIEEKIRERN